MPRVNRRGCTRRVRWFCRELVNNRSNIRCCHSTNTRRAQQQHELHTHEPAVHLCVSIAHAADAPQRRPARTQLLPLAAEVPVPARLAQRVACGDAWELRHVATW